MTERLYNSTDNMAERIDSAPLEEGTDVAFNLGGSNLIDLDEARIRRREAELRMEHARQQAELAVNTEAKEALTVTNRVVQLFRRSELELQNNDFEGRSAA